MAQFVEQIAEAAADVTELAALAADEGAPHLQPDAVAAAALGFARRALDEALARATSRKMFGQTLGDFQLTQAALADMATEIDAAALLTVLSVTAFSSWAQENSSSPNWATVIS